MKYFIQINLFLSFIKDKQLKCAKVLLSLLLISIFFLPTNKAYSLESYDKYWSVATITGSFPEHHRVKYYFEPQLRLIDNPYVFNQLFLFAGLGYQVKSNVTFFMGPGLNVIKNNEGKIIEERRLWQQLNWLVFNTPTFNLNSRSRLEERALSSSSQLSARVRERLWLRVPIKGFERYSFSCFDEVFFNLNSPAWVPPTFFEQNRAFIGIATTFKKTTLIDVGYLNQYINTRELNNVFLLSFTINL